MKKSELKKKLSILYKRELSIAKKLFDPGFVIQANGNRVKKKRGFSNNVNPKTGADFVQFTEASVYFWKSGNTYHRKDGPAVIRRNYLAWYQNDVFHRTDGPARIGEFLDEEEFFINGKKMTREGYEKHFDIKESKFRKLVNESK